MLYDDPGYAPIRASQEARQVRVRNRFLAIVCTEKTPFYNSDSVGYSKSWALAFLEKNGVAPEQLAAIEFKVTLPE